MKRLKRGEKEFVYKVLAWFKSNVTLMPVWPDNVP